MSANSVSLVVLALLFIGTLALTVAAVKWGLKWANVAEISFLKAVGLYFLFVLVATLSGVGLGVVLFVGGFEITDVTLNIFGGVGQFLLPCLIIAMLYKVPLGRAVKASIPHLAAIAASILFAFGVIRPFVYQSFAIPTNAMAPTILGEHREGVCPRCGEPAYGNLPDPRIELAPEGVRLVCSSERQSVYVTDTPTKRSGGDRIMICKLLKPRRWDLVVFRFPPDPSENYVKRLVGLLGERLEIRDGAIWINNERMEPPASIRGIRYSPTIEWRGRSFSGPGSLPVALGRDEYFMLGDFVDESADSRFWDRGAPGYPPYAVPESHLLGVVINIYWPPKRWTSFR